MCQPDFCENNGTCQLSDTDFICDCPTGFSGARCESIINPCVLNPCQNNGQCIPTELSYSCNCTDAYTGKFLVQFVQYLYI